MKTVRGPEDGGVKPVVVGVNPGWRSQKALHAAVDEALRRRAPLVVVTDPAAVEDERQSLSEWLAAERVAALEADRVLVTSVAVVREFAGGDLDVSARRLDEQEGLDAVRQAQLLVVGARGLADEPAFRLTSVSRELAIWTSAPVLVVPTENGGAGSQPPEVVVGIGTDALGPALLAAAGDAAASRGAYVTLVHSYDEDRSGDHDSLSRANAYLDGVVEAAHLGGGVRVLRVVTREPAASALLRAARCADLLVVGSRGRGALAGLALGSVSHAVLEAATRPVLVLMPSLPLPRRQPAAGRVHLWPT